MTDDQKDSKGENNPFPPQKFPAGVPYRRPYAVRCNACNHVHRTPKHTTCPKCGSADLKFESN